MSRMAEIGDFLDYVPAAVLVIDLVEHSRLDKATIHSVQRILETTFADAIRVLAINEIYFNYTGDGYVCVLAGNSSARVIDFLNVSIPDIEKRLGRHQQRFRAGIDFGLLRLDMNTLTGKLEHFDLPGIQAARLEAVAAPGQILCTETVHSIFSHHYQKEFSSASLEVSTKDRNLNAFEIKIGSFDKIRDLISSYFFNTHEPAEDQVISVLIVDDALLIIRFMEWTLEKAACKYEITSAKDGREALRIFEPEKYDIAIVDIMMPGGLSGLDVIEEILTLHPNQRIVILSTLGLMDDKIKGIRAGALDYITKPTSAEEVLSRVGRVVSRSEEVDATRKALGTLCRNKEQLQVLLGDAAWLFEAVHQYACDPDDVADGLLRHKAKQLVYEFIERSQPGNDVISLLKVLMTQLNCTLRLAKAVDRMKMKDIYEHLSSLVVDLQTLNPSLDIEFSSNFSSQNETEVPFGSVVALAACELIDNAIAAVRREGRVRADLLVLESAGVVRILVSDDGPGVPTDIENIVFKDTVSTNGPGRGLGLSLVHSAARALDGNISYEFDHGATFTVKIPLERLGA